MISVLRGERSDLAVRLADQAAGLVTLLRVALEDGQGGPDGAVPDPAAPARAHPRPRARCSGSRSPGPATARDPAARGHPTATSLGGSLRRPPGARRSRVLTVGVDIGGTSVRAGVVDADGTVRDTARSATPRSDDALEAAVAGVVASWPAAPDRIGRPGARRVRHPGPAQRAVRAAPLLAGRPRRRPDRRPPRAARRRRARRQRGRAGRTPVRRRRRGVDRGVHRPGHRHRLRAAPGRGAVPGRPRRRARARARPGRAGGRPCPCGKSGCWERYCSGTALAATAVELLAGNGGRSSVLARLVAADPGRSPASGWRRRPGRATAWRSPRWPTWPAGSARG